MKDFDKYRTRGADYHYRQISRSSFRNYNASVDARFRKLVENVERIVGNKKAKLLDVGSGDGVALYLLHQKLPDLELYGVEPNSSALNVAKTYLPYATLKEGVADALPYSDDFFDVVISSDVIEHVENPDKMLQEIKRVAKKDAIILVGTPVRHSKTPVDHNHVQEWFVEDFLEMMQKYFRDCELRESHKLAITLLYNAPTRSFLNFRYLINFFSIILRINPFLTERTNRIQMFAYMYVICKK